MEKSRLGPILVTGAAGDIGAVGRHLTAMLLAGGYRVRALVRRGERHSAARFAIATCPSTRGDQSCETGVSEHLLDHLTVTSELNKQGRYDRMTDDYLKLTGEPPTNMRDFVTLHADNFTRRKAAA